MDNKTLAKHMKALEDKHGCLTPDTVVDAARPEDSPLHDLFEWDDSVAAEAWRRQQARGYITSVMVLIETQETEIKSVAYVRDPRLPQKEQGYIATERVKTQDELVHDVMADELIRIESLLVRIHQLATAFDLEKEVEQVQRKVGRWRQVIAKHIAGDEGRTRAQ